MTDDNDELDTLIWEILESDNNIDYDYVKQAINRHAYDTAMRIVGEDTNVSRVVLDGDSYFAEARQLRAVTQNSLRAELRQAFASEYGIEVQA